MKITIKSKYDQNGNEYFFAENEKGQIFGSFHMYYYEFSDDLLRFHWQFESLEHLELKLEEYKKSLGVCEIIKTIVEDYKIIKTIKW